MDDTSDLLSNDQKYILRWILSICSASLSAIGSSLILFKILRDRAQTGSMTSYERIILGLSGCDIITSITYAINPFLVPRETGNVWAFGNRATCTARGFMTQLTLASFWYNCLLSYYFLLTVISQVRRKNIVRIFEPFMHLTVMFFPVTAIMGLRRGWFNNDTCWYLDAALAWIVAGIPTIFTYLSLIINNIAIYCMVRKALRSSAASPTSVQKRLKREARTLMFLYVGCYVITISPTFAINIIFIYGGNVSYPLQVLDNFLLPLQGFFNFFIYIRPAYIRFRAANPDKPIFFILKHALFDPNVPQLEVSRGHTASLDILGDDGANPNHSLFKSEFRPSYSSSDSSSAEEGDETTNREDDTTNREADGE